MFDAAKILCRAEFECLDYHNIKDVDFTGRQIIANTMVEFLYELLKGLNYQHLVPLQSSALRDRLRTWAKSQLSNTINEHAIAHMDALIHQAASIVEHCYPLASGDSSFTLAKCTVAIIAIDDFFMKDSSRKQLASFQLRYFTGELGGDSWSKMYADTITEYAKHFGSDDPVVGALGAMAWANFATANALEDRFALNPPVHFSLGKPSKGPNHRCPDRLPHYLRTHTGVSQPYALAIFKPSREDEVPLNLWIAAFPDLLDFINFVNDVLTFSKEVFDGETVTYISLLTKAKRENGQKSRFYHDGRLWTVRDTLCEVSQQLTDITSTLDQALKCPAIYNLHGPSKSHIDHYGETDNTRQFQRCSNLWTAFKQGYIAWHINSGRYPLDALKFRYDSEIRL